LARQAPFPLLFPSLLSWSPLHPPARSGPADEASSSFPPSRRRRPSDDLFGCRDSRSSTAPTWSSGSVSSSCDPRLMFPLFAWVFWHLWVHFCLLLEQKEKRFCMPN
ncbi:unnamed protein product, partial [Musa banksii]